MLTYMLLALVVLLIIALMWSLTRVPSAHLQLMETNQMLMDQNRELLNRLQAPDVRTFLALQTSSTPPSSEEYIPRDDESEVKRLDAEGVGEMILLTDEEIKAYALGDFNLNHYDNS